MKKLKLITHNGAFHADDIFAAATLSIFLDNEGDSYEIFRTRDLDTVKNGDYVFDVGGIYDPSINRFDHHQKGGAGNRENGIPYAAFGLVWKHFGMDVCENDQYVWDSIEKKLVSPFDAIDNGIDITSNIFSGINPASLAEYFLINSPTWKENDSNIDNIFKEQVKAAILFLKREIKVAKDDREGFNIIMKAYEESEDKKIIKLNVSLPRYLYQGTLCRLPEPLFLVYPSAHGPSWKVEAISKNENTMESRKSFPEKWRGLVNGSENQDEIKKLINADGVLFTHQSGFLANLDTEENAMKFALLAVES